MSFDFQMRERAAEGNRLNTESLARDLKDRQLTIDREAADSEAALRKANQGVESANIELARRKAQQKLDNFNSGVVSAKDKEQEMSDFERKKQSGDYDLDNQIKAWGAANQYRMSEADQSNVAQKDRLGMQLDTQKTMQQTQIGQENRLRSDDNRRAIDGFNLNF